MAELMTYHTDKYGHRPMIECFRNIPEEWEDGNPFPWTGWTVEMTMRCSRRFEVVRNCNVKPFSKYQHQYHFLPIFHSMIVAYAGEKVTGIMLVEQTQTADMLLTNFPLYNVEQMKCYDMKEKPEKGVSTPELVIDGVMLFFFPACPNQEFQQCLQEAQAEAKAMSKLTRVKAYIDGWYEVCSPTTKFFIHYDAVSYGSSEIVLVERMNEIMT